MTYHTKLLYRYIQLESRLCPFHSEGEIALARDGEEIEEGDCTEEELEFAVEHLEDLHYDGVNILFYEEAYDQPSTEHCTIRFYNYVIDVSLKHIENVVVYEKIKSNGSIFVDYIC